MSSRQVEWRGVVMSDTVKASVDFISHFLNSVVVNMGVYQTFLL